MSLDGAMLHNIAVEIINIADGARVNKVMQPSRDEIILHMRTKEGNKKLLVNLVASNARIHFTDLAPDNPQNPPMFSMLLRKKLTSARLVSIDQYGLDRVITLVFEGHNDFGDIAKLSIVIEIMGKYSNMVLLDENSRIVDAVKRIDFSSSTGRQLLPGLFYKYPEKQNKLNILETDVSDIVKKVLTLSQPLSKALLETLEGFSPLPAREISFKVTGGIDTKSDELSTQEQEKLNTELKYIKSILKDASGEPTMITALDGKPKDFTFIPVTMYGDLMQVRNFSSYSGMLDYFYANRDSIERMRQRSGTLLKLVKNTAARIDRRLSAQRQELEDSKNKEIYKVKGDILTANLYRIEKGQNEAVLENFYENNNPIVIELDTRKTPSQNAQKYYALYRKQDTAEKKLTELIKIGEKEKAYIETVLDSLMRSETEIDLNSIKEELADAGYIKKVALKKQQKIKPLPPHEFLSSDGVVILVGRNNNQNDQLTLKDSSKTDMWFHVKDSPGSHVIAKINNVSITDKTLEEAAILAAYYSSLKDTGKVDVDYTEVKNVKKPSGSKPGMVIYNTFKTITVLPDRDTVDKLKKV